MLKILLSGANGKMGHTISRLVSESEDCRIIAGIDLATTPYSDFEIYSSPSEFKGKADVIIDFSHPSALEGILSYATQNNTPIVVSTTGLSAEQVDKIIKCALKVPVFFSANMSIGINLLIDLVQKAAAILEGNFDIEIVERHHNQKIDAPSGTAMMIADSISDVLKTKPQYVYDRHSVRKKRESNEIGIHAVRGGNIVGDHDVIFAGNDEVIEISHKATSKEVFAVGSIRAAKYIAQKGAGLYNMHDLISGK